MPNIILPREEFDSARVRTELEAEAISNAELINTPRGPAWKTTVWIQTPEGIRESFMAISCGCENHRMARMTVACKHCKTQDEVHPVGIVHMPKGYYLCTTCSRLYEHRKSKLFNELVLECSTCINLSIATLKGRDPSLFMDLRPGSVR